MKRNNRQPQTSSAFPNYPTYYHHIILLHNSASTLLVPRRATLDGHRQGPQNQQTLTQSLLFYGKNVTIQLLVFCPLHEK